MNAEKTKRARPVIYQLMVRTFGNTNETRKWNGTLAENGCGKFRDINLLALESIRAMGFTHLWLTGVLEQASGTAYPGRPADPPDILKGIAGSPYAIRDYFDVCPDYAVEPQQRLEEFQELLERCHSLGLRAIIDFIPNHVARSYESDVRPRSSFGNEDDVSVFFARDNHFYYLRPDDAGGGPPLTLPTAHHLGCSGLYIPEDECGRVTGNNAITWSPAASDWYETVKLNYGHDFTQGRDTSHLPGVDAALAEVPKTWRTMDEILAYWQTMGVSGFRVDMAHMVPMEFWKWSVSRARIRERDVYFIAEAYDNDSAKLTASDVLNELLDSGFDAVYDDPSYDILEGIYDDGKWANDLDALIFTGPRFHHSLRYTENHDEVRIANPKVWGGLGMMTGRPVSAVLFALGRGPVMLYQGQEVGEPALGSEGFGDDNGRSSIFDYTSLPELCKWINGGKYDGGKLSDEQQELRAWYAKLLRVTQAAAFTTGDFYGLNAANRLNPNFGRLSGESVSGHWIYSFLRHDFASGETFLVVANFHGSEIARDMEIIIPDEAWSWMNRDKSIEWSWVELLEEKKSGKMMNGIVAVGNLAPCSAAILAF